MEPQKARTWVAYGLSAAVVTLTATPNPINRDHRTAPRSPGVSRSCRKSSLKSSSVFGAALCPTRVSSISLKNT